VISVSSVRLAPSGKTYDRRSRCTRSTRLSTGSPFMGARVSTSSAVLWTSQWISRWAVIPGPHRPDRAADPADVADLADPAGLAGPAEPSECRSRRPRRSRRTVGIVHRVQGSPSSLHAVQVTAMWASPWVDMLLRVQRSEPERVAVSMCCAACTNRTDPDRDPCPVGSVVAWDARGAGPPGEGAPQARFRAPLSGRHVTSSPAQRVYPFMPGRPVQPPRANISGRGSASVASDRSSE
jgi:hypothetical protein